MHYMKDDGLKTAWYYILLSLANEDRHGLSIARDVEALSDRRVRLWPASLYGSLAELSERGWIAEVGVSRRPADESDKLRIYRLTRAGQTVVEAETERLAALVRTARARVKPRARES